MSNIYSLANQFVKSVESEQLKFAGRENRKSIEKKLRDAKMVYDTRRLSLQGKRKTYEDLASVIDKETGDMNFARDYMRKAYDILKNMDEIDCGEVRWNNGDDVGYIKGKGKGRVYRLKFDEQGGIELEPFHKKTTDDNDLELSEDDDGMDASGEDDLMAADELLNSLY